MGVRKGILCSMMLGMIVWLFCSGLAGCDSFEIRSSLVYDNRNNDKNSIGVKASVKNEKGNKTWGLRVPK